MHERDLRNRLHALVCFLRYMHSGEGCTCVKSGLHRVLKEGQQALAQGVAPPPISEPQEESWHRSSPGSRNGGAVDGNVKLDLCAPLSLGLNRWGSL